MAINWYPGHMHKATKEIKDILPKIDVIIEVLDARIPYSSENPVINQLRGEKPLIRLLNKSDLADPAITDEWIKHIESEKNVKATAVCSKQPDKIKNLAHLCYKLAPNKHDAADDVHAVIMGIPNVGKSTIINILAGRDVAKTGNEPAVTKGQQRIKLGNGVMLHDTPGILWPKFENQKSGYRLAVTGAIKDTAITHDDIAFFMLEYLMQVYPQQLLTRYKMEKIPASEVEFMELVGKQRGCLGSGGHVDFDKVAKILLNEFRDGTIGNITLETPAMAIQEELETIALIEEKTREKEEKKNQRKKKRKK